MNFRNAATHHYFYIPFALIYLKNNLCARDELKLQVKNMITVALSILGEPSNITLITNSGLCKLLKADYNECGTTLSIMRHSTNPTCTGIRRHSDSDTNVRLSNHFMILQSEVNLKSQTDMDHREKPSNTENTISKEMKKEIHPFYVEFNEISGRKIKAEVKYLDNDNPPLVLKGELLKIQFKSEEQFWIIQCPQCLDYSIDPKPVHLALNQHPAYIYPSSPRRLTPEENLYERYSAWHGISNNHSLFSLTLFHCHTGSHVKK